MKLLAALIVAGLAAAGCATSTAADGQGAVPSASAEAPTTTATPSPSASAEAPTASASPVQRALPDTAGDDPVKAIEEIIKYRWYLLENPRPSDLTLIYAKRCLCYDVMHERISQLVEEDLRVRGAGPVITNTELLNREGALATVRYTVALSPFEVVAESGEVVDTSDGTPARRQEAILLRDTNRWRVQDIKGVE